MHDVDSAPAYWWLDILWVVLVDGADTGGRYSLMHETLPKGSGAPPHKHTWSDEHFYMLEGKCTFLVAKRSTSDARETSYSCRGTPGMRFASTAKVRHRSRGVRWNDAFGRRHPVLNHAKFEAGRRIAIEEGRSLADVPAASTGISAIPPNLGTSFTAMGACGLMALHKTWLKKRTRSLEPCATNSAIVNGLPSSRCCPTNRVAFGV